MNADSRERIATLWRLCWKGQVVSCALYRRADAVQMRLECGSTLLIAEPFDLRPQAFARLRTLRASLKRRGWLEPPAK